MVPTTFITESAEVPGDLNVAVEPEFLEDLVVVVGQHLPLLLEQRLQQRIIFNNPYLNIAMWPLGEGGGGGGVKLFFFKK